MSAAMEAQYPRQSARLYLDLSVYWFSLSFLWSGLITIIMQDLVYTLVGPEKKDLYLGWVLGAGALVSTLICLVIGAISDRSRFRLGRRRPFVIVGSLLTVPALLSLGWAHSIAWVALAFCLIQLWANVATSPYQAMVPDMVPKGRQGTASAYLGMAALLGTLGGLAACGMMYDKLGGPGFMNVLALLAGLMALSMAYSAWRLPEPSAEANPAPQIGILATMADGFKVKPREHPSFFLLIASRFMVNMGFYTVTEFLSYYVRDTLKVPGDSVKQVVMLIMVLATATGVIGNIPAGVLSDRHSKKLVLYISCAVTGLSALCFILANSVTMAYITAGLFGVGWGAFQAVDWALATNLLPQRDEAKYMGVWHIAFTVPQVIAPLLGGIVAYLCNRLLGPGVGYRAVMACVLLYLVIGTLLVRPIKEVPIAPAQEEGIAPC